MARVLVTRHVPPGGLDPLVEAGHEIVSAENDAPYSPEELRDLAPGVDAIISMLTDQITEEILQAGASGILKVVANAAVGYDNVDVASAHRLGLSVCNTPGVLDQTTADLAFLLILASRRQTSSAEADLRDGTWKGWGFLDHLAHDIHDATLGLVGYGRIGQEVARRAEGFGMTILHHTRTPTGRPGYVASLWSLIEQSDVLSVHVPLTPETHHLIGPEEFAMFQRTSTLVNTSRGPVVDEDALVDALEAGKLFGAGLDVFDGEPAINPRILTAPRIVLLPHIGSATVETRTNMARLASQGVCAVLAGQTPINIVLG